MNKLNDKRVLTTKTRNSHCNSMNVLFFSHCAIIIPCGQTPWVENGNDWISMVNE